MKIFEPHSGPFCPDHPHRDASPARSLLNTTALGGRTRLAVAVMLCAFGLVGEARADCSPASIPADAAGISALFNRLAQSVAAEPLAMAVMPRGNEGACNWVYEVKVLTQAGSVAFLDFDVVNLDLTRVNGSQADPEIARLAANLQSRNSPIDPDGVVARERDGTPETNDDGKRDEGGSDDGGEGGENSGEGGEGGENSGEGGESGGSGEGGESGGSGEGGESGGSGEGGESGGGGEGGSGGKGGGGGEGGGD